MTDKGILLNNLPKLMADFRQTVILVFENYPFAVDIMQHFRAGG